MERWETVGERIARACAAAGRDPGGVEILAAVKTQSPEHIAELLDCGARLIGQNRAQELIAIDPALRALRPTVPFATHFIGYLQSNKVGRVVDLVSCVQSVDRLGLATRLSRAAADRSKVLEVFVQVNASGESTKAGVSPDDALELAREVAALPSLRLRGLMTIGANSLDPAEVAAGFETMRELSRAVVGSGIPGTSDANELSMGMSRDLEMALTHGATMVRLGTDIFGPRSTA